MYGKFEITELKPYIGKESVEILGLKFELTEYKRDKDSRSPVPIWVHKVEGATYIIHATPYLNGYPALQLSIDYVEDERKNDTRHITEREHDIGNAVYYESIRSFEEYRVRVKIMAEQMLKGYFAMIQKQQEELTGGMQLLSDVLLCVADAKNISIEDMYPYMGKDNIVIRGMIFELVLEEKEGIKDAVWLSIRKDEKLGFVREYKVYATPKLYGMVVPVQMYDVFDNDLGFIGYNQSVTSYEQYKQVVRKIIDEIFGNLADDEEQQRFGGFEE